MKTKTFIITIFISLMSFVFTGFSQILPLEIIGQTPGGGGYTVAWDENGQQLIIGCGTSIWVCDMTNPQNPVKIKKRPLLGTINEMILDGNVLFVAATHDGVYALDYTTQNLDILAHYNMKGIPGAAYGMHLYNDTMYVADHTGVKMLSYTHGIGFANLGSFGPDRAFGVHRKGNLIAICSQYKSLVSDGIVQVYSTADLTTPLAEWESPLINTVMAIQFADLRDDIIYVCGGPESALFDKSHFFALQFDGNNVFPVDTFTVQNGVPGIAQQNIINMDSRNDTLFIATTAAWDPATLPFCHTVVLDATNLPNNKMVEIGRVTPGFWHFDVALMHGTPYAAISSEWLGVSINDVSQLAFMDTIAFIETGGWSVSSKVRDNTLYVCNEGWGFIAYDIDSLLFSNGYWCNATKFHIHDLSDHFFSSSFDFLNDSLILLDNGRVYNIKPALQGGAPVHLYSIGRGAKKVTTIHTDIGTRMIYTYHTLNVPRIEIFNPFDSLNNYVNVFSDTTNSAYSGIAVSRDTIYYGKKHGNTRYLIAAKISNDVVVKIDSIILPSGFLAIHDVFGISVENGKIAVAYGKHLALLGWNAGHMEILFNDYLFNRTAVDVVLRNNYMYVVDKFYGLRIFDVSSYTQPVLVAETWGTGGWMNVFGGLNVSVGNDGQIYMTDFMAGVIIIKAFDTTQTTIGAFHDIAFNSNQNLQIYPNPTSEYVTVEILKDELLEKSHIIVYDVVGREVMRMQVTQQKTKIETSGWQSGVYILNWTNNKSIISRKLIIN